MCGIAIAFHSVDSFNRLPPAGELTVNTDDTTIVVHTQWHVATTEAVAIAGSKLRDVAQIPLELQHVLQLVQNLLMVSTGATGVAIALGDVEGMQCVCSIGDAPAVNIPLQLDGTLSGHCI